MTAVRWNIDKKHRCPECHAIAVDMERPKSAFVYTCCRCATRFTRWPRLAWLLRDVGVVCSEHRPASAPPTRARRLARMLARHPRHWS